jgi:hypothetical protein
VPGHSNTLITDHGARAEACSNVGAVKVNVGALRGSVRVLKGGRVVKANFGVSITDHRVPRSAPLGHRAVVLIGQPPFIFIFTPPPPGTPWGPYVALDCRPGEPARASHTRHPTLRHSRSPATRPSIRTVAPRRSPPKSQPAARLALLPVTTRARRRADTKDPQGTPKARPHPRQHRAHARPRPCQPATPTTRDDRHGTTITPCKHTVHIHTHTYTCSRTAATAPTPASGQRKVAQRREAEPPTTRGRTAHAGAATG